jgi:hypothetical protein
MTKEKLLSQLSKRGKGKYYAVFNEFKDVVLTSTPIELINYFIFQFDLSEAESACLNYTGIRYAQINFKKKYGKDGGKAAHQPQGKTGRNGGQWQFNDSSENTGGKPKFFKKQPI